MKRINLWILCVLPFIFSCTEENFEVQENEVVLEESASSKDGIAFRTTCDIAGPICGAPGTTEQFTYNRNFTTSNITWSVQSGNMTIVNGQGTSTATVSFGLNFTGGSLTALGTGRNGLLCSDVVSISRCITPPPCTPPTEIEIKQLAGECEGEIFSFLAETNGSTSSGSYSWAVFPGTITSGQGTAAIIVQSPASGGFSVSVTHVNDCQNRRIGGSTQAVFDASRCPSIGSGFGF